MRISELSYKYWMTTASKFNFLVAFDDYPGRGEFACNGYQYAWNNAKVAACGVTFSGTGKLEGKTDNLYHILIKKFSRPRQSTQRK